MKNETKAIHNIYIITTITKTYGRFMLFIAFALSGQLLGQIDIIMLPMSRIILVVVFLVILSVFFIISKKFSKTL